jgi:hypothetical protein
VFVIPSEFANAFAGIGKVFAAGTVGEAAGTLAERPGFAPTAGEAAGGVTEAPRAIPQQAVSIGENSGPYGQPGQ